jgi:alpha-tubulin suppressor-like RCC1 family protein
MEPKSDYQSSIYVWGRTIHGALLGCLDPKVKAASTTKVQLMPKHIAECCTTRMNGGFPIRVVARDGYATVITNKFEAYTWGDGIGRGGKQRNASGIQRAKSRSCETKKVQVDGMTSIVHGIGHNYSLNLKGDIYFWGNIKSAKSITDHGKPRPQHSGSGGSDSRRTSIDATKIDLGNNSLKVDTVACGEKHACVLLQNGMLLTTGANDAGQLGTGISFPDSGSAQFAVSVASGHSFTGELK